MDPASTIARLLAAPIRPGCVGWIGLRPERRAPLVLTRAVQAQAGQGLTGDRARPNGARQVTLVQAEHLDAIAAYLGVAPIDPALLRRNIVVSGINLLALKNQRFQVGAVILQGTGDCHPCSRMEEALGVGGYNAVRGHGGITARVITGGSIAIGDSVVRLDEPPEPEPAQPAQPAQSSSAA